MSIGTAPQALRREALEAPGGFLWWYVDLVDAEGNGAVLIWSFGLPFLPGRESSARRGQGRPARLEPSLAVSVYRHGQPDFYLLQAFEPHEASVDLDAGTLQLGNSRFVSVEVDGRRVVEAHIDTPLPGAPPLVGTLHLEGAALQVPASTVAAGHVWAPLTTATTGRLVLHVGDEPLVDLRGRAYHDCNGSTEPLSGLGIAEWGWGRRAEADHEDVHYVLWPEGGGPPQAHLLSLHGDGRVHMESAAVEVGPRGRGWWRLPWHPDLTLTGTDTGRVHRVEAGPIVDDGPFYLRHLLGEGMAEWVCPARVDLWWMRPFVDMCVHRPHRANPFLAPFFTGRRRGRVQRLVPGRPALTSSVSE